VFAGGCTADAAAAVRDATNDELEALADRSLLQRDESDEGQRYRMLETVRELALERLEQSAVVEDVRRRHAEYFTALAAEAAAVFWSPEPGREWAHWLERLEADYGNLRAVLAWAGQADTELQLRIAADLHDFWVFHCHFAEGRGWLEHGLAHSDDAVSPTRAKALHSAAFLALAQGDYGHCAARAEESVALYRALGDREGVGRTMHLLSQSAAEQGDDRRALAFAEESLSLARELGHARGITVSLTQAGESAARIGDLQYAGELLDEAKRLALAHADELAHAAILVHESRLALSAGRPSEARQLAGESAVDHRAATTWRGVITTGPKAVSEMAATDDNYLQVMELVPTSAMYAVVIERYIKHPDEQRFSMLKVRVTED
jgi:hypothetical protein